MKNTSRQPRPILRSEVLHIRITPDLRRRIEKAAAAERRSITNMVEVVLDRGLPVIVPTQISGRNGKITAI